MGVATLMLVVSLLATLTLADIGYESRLSPVELAIIKSVVDAVPKGGISLGNPYDWAALQTRSRALQGADVQVVQVQDRNPDFSGGRSGSYPDDASIVQAVSSQLGNLEGPPLVQGGGSNGWNLQKSVSAELHLNAQVLPDLPAKQPSLKHVSYNYQEPAFNGPPSGAHVPPGGGETFSFHRSIASELNAAMFDDVPAQQQHTFFHQQQNPVFNNYQHSYSQPQTQQFDHQQTFAFNNQQQQSFPQPQTQPFFHQHQQQVPAFNYHQQFSGVSGGQTSGGGYSDVSIHGSVPYDLPSNMFVPPRPPSLQEKMDIGQFNPSTSYNNNYQEVSGAHKPAGGLSEFSIQKSIASEITSDTLSENRGDEQPVQYPIDIRMSENTKTFASSSGNQNTGQGIGFSNQQSLSNDIPTELFAPPAQTYTQWNQNQESGGVSDVSIQKSIASEVTSGEAQQHDYSQSEGFVESSNANHGTEQESYAKQVNQLPFDEGATQGHENQHQGTADGADQEKADFVEVNIVQTVSSKQSADEETSSGSHEATSETDNNSSAENSDEYNVVQESSSSEDDSREGDDQVAGVSACAEGERRIKNICRKVYSLQLKAHLRKK